MIIPQSSAGFAASLAHINWDIFASLTFAGKLPIQRRAWRLAWMHLFRAAQSCGVPYSKALIALRSEHGELGDRLHFHYLLGGMEESNLYSLAFRLAYDWKCATGGAHAEIRPYDPQLAGADYIEKCLGGGNLYELGKFNRSDRLELSASVLKRVQFTLRRRGEQHNASQGIGKNRRDAESLPVSVKPSVSESVLHFPRQWVPDKAGVFHLVDKPGSTLSQVSTSSLP